MSGSLQSDNTTNSVRIRIQMLFNSVEFAIFMVVVYGLYLVLDHKWQNRMLLVASYVFYGTWDWRFLSLIFFSTVLDYVCGLKIHASNSVSTTYFPKIQKNTPKSPIFSQSTPNSSKQTPNFS